MNVLIISSSPRRGGNSDLLCDEFLRGATAAGHQSEKIFLGDLRIAPCTGCGLCFQQPGVCSQADGMAELKARLLAADVIVLATPIYFYTMCGQMKAFIDRLCALSSQLTDKSFYYLMAAADEEDDVMRRTVDGFQGLLDCLKGAQAKGYVCATGVFEKGAVRGTPFMQRAYQLGEGISGGV